MIEIGLRGYYSVCKIETLLALVQHKSDSDQQSRGALPITVQYGMVHRYSR